MRSARGWLIALALLTLGAGGLSAPGGGCAVTLTLPPPAPSNVTALISGGLTGVIAT